MFMCLNYVIPNRKVDTHEVHFKPRTIESLHRGNGFQEIGRLAGNVFFYYIKGLSNASDVSHTLRFQKIIGDPL